MSHGCSQNAFTLQLPTQWRIFHIYYVYMKMIKFVPFVGSFGIRIFVNGKRLEGSNTQLLFGDNFRLLTKPMLLENRIT